MIKLMMKDWDGWTYERSIIPYIKKNNIQLRSQRLLSTLVPTKGICTIPFNAIVRGVWNVSAVDFLKEHNMEEIIKRRKVIGPLNNWLYQNTPSPQSIWRYPFWGVLKVLKKYRLNW